MRPRLNTIQQTLTPEASAVLAASVIEAARRNHSQTTPLHVAASLLESPSGFLRNACIRSHPNSSHPLQCRPLELCFGVALERLPSYTGPGHQAPHVSNALMAALKRAQAHQRRGCPEQPATVQQPLLAVKVELEQLVISILDDPSVSRVMGEASFSSPAVKAAIEQSAVAPNTNMYLNPRLQQGDSVQNDESKRIMDILMRRKKNNPILIGGNEPRVVINQVLMRIQKGEVLKNIEITRLDNDIVSDQAKLVNEIRELGRSTDAEVGVMVDLGDLKWVVEVGKAVVDEVAKVVARFGHRRLWLIGTATCETYMRCQLYYPTMESDWDLQAVSVAPSMFPRLEKDGILKGLIESPSPMKTFQGTNVIQSLGPKRTSNHCPQCNENYEQEMLKLVANEYHPEPARPALPQWLQNAKSDKDDSQTKDQETAFKQKAQDLQKKWSDTCLRIHPNFHNNLGSQKVRPPMTLYNPKLLFYQPLQQKPQPNKALGLSLQLNSNPKSPVRTDLVLGRPKNTEPSLENTENKRVKDLLGCVSSVEKFTKTLDTDLYKKLLKRLTERVWWQKEAASKVASKLGHGTLSKSDRWLLFIGPDRVGKKKMANVISEQMCGRNPIMICVGRRSSEEEIVTNLRGKTVLDRIVEAVRKNPFSVIMLEDIDEADIIIRGNIRKAMEKGRLSDSYGREISLGNVIFILTTDWLPDNFRKLNNEEVLDENNFASRDGWQLRLQICEKRAKRRANWVDGRDRLIKPRKELGSGLSLDLNRTADFDDDPTDGSLNSSDLTVDLDYDQIQRSSITFIPIELANFVDDAIVFKPVEIVSVRNEIKNKITEKFSYIVDEIPLEVDEEALERIIGGVWVGKTDLEEWGENVLLPSFRKIKTVLPLSSDENLVVRLEIDSVSSRRSTGDWLPSTIRV